MCEGPETIGKMKFYAGCVSNECQGKAVHTGYIRATTKQGTHLMTRYSTHTRGHIEVAMNDARHMLAKLRFWFVLNELLAE